MSVGFTGHFDWTVALMLTHTAKKKAESSVGVGRATDLWWITDKIQEFPPEHPLIVELDKIHVQRVKRDTRGMISDVKQISKHLEAHSGAAEQGEQAAQSESGTEAAEQSGLSEGSEKSEPAS